MDFFECCTQIFRKIKSQMHKSCCEYMPFQYRGVCALDNFVISLINCGGEYNKIWVESQIYRNNDQYIKVDFYGYNNGDWVTIPNESQYISGELTYPVGKAIITCLLNDETVELTIERTANNAAAFIDYLRYMRNGIPEGFVNSNDTLYIRENDKIKLYANNNTRINIKYVRLPSLNELGSDNKCIVKYSDLQTDPQLFNIYFSPRNYPECVCMLGMYIAKILTPSIIGTLEICNTPGASTNLSLSGYDSYKWYFNGVFIGETSNNIEVDTAGNYYCICTKHGLTVQSNTVTVSFYTYDVDLALQFDDSEAYFDGTTYHFKSTTIGVNLTVVDNNQFSGGFPAGTTFEWVGLTPPTVGLNTYFASSPGTYIVNVRLPGGMGGCTYTSPEINFAFDISDGLYVYNCKFPYSTDPSIYDALGFIDNGDGTYDISVQPGYWKNDPNPHVPAYPINTPNGTWSRVYPSPALLQTGGITVTVNQPGWYVYKQEAPTTDVIGTGDGFNGNFSSILSNLNKLLPWTLTITYESGSTPVTLCCDDGGYPGVILHSIYDELNNVVGSFNSSTGQVDLVLSVIPDNGADISATYGINCAYGDGLLILIQ